MKEFLAKIEDMCKYDLGDAWRCRYKLHNWEEMFFNDYDAVTAYKLAVSYE